MHTEEGQAALGRVLLAFSVHRPDIGYCQGMNAIAAMLLLVLERNEEDSFWVLVSLIDNGGTLPFTCPLHKMHIKALDKNYIRSASCLEIFVRKGPKLCCFMIQRYEFLFQVRQELLRLHFCKIWANPAIFCVCFAWSKPEDVEGSKCKKSAHHL